MLTTFSQIHTPTKSSPRTVTQTSYIWPSIQSAHGASSLVRRRVAPIGGNVGLC